MEAESNIVVQTKFLKEASASDVVLSNKNNVRLVAYSDEESDEEMSIVEPDSTVDIIVDEGLSETNDAEQCKDKVIEENVCSSTNGGVINSSNAIECCEIEQGHCLVEQKEDILMNGNCDGSQFDENHSVSQQEGQQSNHFFEKSKTDVCEEINNSFQAVDKKEDELKTGKETEIVMEENRNCIFLKTEPEKSNDGICGEINKTYREVDRKDKATEKETEQVIQETWNNNFPVKEPENNISMDDSFCDMSDLAFVAEIVAQAPSTSPLKSRQPRRIKDQKETDDVLEKASQQLGKKLIAVASDSSETEDSSEDSSSSEASSSSSTTSSSSSSDNSDDETDVAKIREIIDYDENQGVSLQPPKTKDEILPQELPQQPEIEIELPDDAKLDPIGEIQSYVEMMIVIKARKDTPALDAETLFFLEDRKLLGMVFDVFGPVQNPFYVVRFDKEERFKNMGIKIGDPIFYAPNYLNMTNYVFVEQLKRMKGSDASWQHDQEPPPELLEFSDDEEEAKAKSAARKRRQNERKELESYDADADDDDDVAMQNKPQSNKHRQNGIIHSDQNKQSGETLENRSAHVEPSQKPTRGRGRGRGRGTQLSLTPTHSYPQHGNLQGNNFSPRGNRPTLLPNDIGQHNNESGFEQRYPGPGGPRFGSDLRCKVPPMFALNCPPGAQSRHPEPFNGPRFQPQGAQFSPTLPRPPHDQMFRGPMHPLGYQFPGVPIHAPHPPMFDPTVPPPALNSMPPHFDPSIPPPGTLLPNFDPAVPPPVSDKARPIFDRSIPPPSVPPNMPPFNWQPPT